MAYRRRIFRDNSGQPSNRQPATGDHSDDDSATDDDQIQATPSKSTDAIALNPLLHPWLTNFGPSSLQRYLRAEIQKTRPRITSKVSPGQRTGSGSQKIKNTVAVARRHNSLAQDSKSLTNSPQVGQLIEPSVARDAIRLSFPSSNTAAIDIPKINIRRRRDSTDVEDETDASPSGRAQPVRDMDLSSPTKRLKRLALSNSSSERPSPPELPRSSSFSENKCDKLASFVANESTQSASAKGSAPRRSNRLRGMGLNEELEKNGAHNSKAIDIAARPESVPDATAMTRRRLTAERTGPASDLGLQNQTPSIASSQLHNKEMRRTFCEVLLGSETPLSKTGFDLLTEDRGSSALEDGSLAKKSLPMSTPLVPSAVHDAQDKHIAMSDEQTYSSSPSKAKVLEDIVRSECSAVGTLDDLTEFDYSKLVPEPPTTAVATNLQPRRAGRSPGATSVRLGNTHDAIGNPSYSRTAQQPAPAVSIRHAASSSAPRHNTVSASVSTSTILSSQFPKRHTAEGLPRGPQDPPFCGRSRGGKGWSIHFSSDEIDLVCRWLSVEDVHNVRLVNKKFAEMVTPILFKRVVVPFNKDFFNPGLELWDSKLSRLPSSNPVRKYGNEISKFAISFEVDLRGLATAQPKHLQHDAKAWWGGFSWPLPAYPRFPSLQILEDSLDSNRLHLRETFKNLSGVTELGLSVDSGHGWLNGPDISDMAVFDTRCGASGRVFGKTFRGENKWHEFGRDRLFEWAQLKTLDETMKDILATSAPAEARRLEEVVTRWIRTRGRSCFVHQSHDFQTLMHTGGVPSQPAVDANQAMPAGGQIPHPIPGGQGMQGNAVQAPNILATQQVAPVRPRHTPAARIPRHIPVDFPQWPIIINGFNVSAGAGGASERVQSRLAPPAEFPLKPGELTEAQVQWLMETIWAQRAFLSAYVTAVIMNKPNLSGVRSLCLAKLSSGLISSLAHAEFWSALPALKAVTILVSPDWRREHTPGDRAFSANMPISPIEASVKLAKLLRSHICPLEHLTKLVVGFVGGGEHATGIFARNKHVLPAPVTIRPREWTIDHKFGAPQSTLLKFDHIKDLKFQNCWFSPCMLETFMEKSADTSLRHLTLESVSLTGTHSHRTDGALTAQDAPKPRHGRSDWLHERLPNEGCWPDILDKITPGLTLFERKVAAGIVDPMSTGALQYERGFRGHVQKITLKSCGYAKISGVNPNDFNQNGLVEHRDTDRGTVMDNGLLSRKIALRGELVNFDDQRPNQPLQAPGHANHFLGLGPHNALAAPTGPVAQNPRRPGRHWRSESSLSPLMMSIKDPATGSQYFGLGRLTQAVTPVEKRILEEAWGCTFGWGNTLDRHKAVEDGCLEGGTGRFSGVISVAENDTSGIQYRGNRF